MARKRKSEATQLDEVDRTLYSTFRASANSLSQLYESAMKQQKLSLLARERHGLEKLYQWILSKQEEGSRLTVAEIVAHIQNEINSGVEDAPVPSSVHLPNQHSQNSMQSTNPIDQAPFGLFGQETIGSAPQISHSDRSRNLVFMNALSSPVSSSLQPYHLTQGGGYCSNSGNPPTGSGHRNNELETSHNWEANSASSNDMCMDMHLDSPSAQLINLINDKPVTAAT